MGHSRPLGEGSFAAESRGAFGHTTWSAVTSGIWAILEAEMQLHLAWERAASSPP